MSVPGRKWSGPEAKAGAVSKENLLGVWLLSQASQMLQGAWDRENSMEDTEEQEGYPQSQGLESREGRPYPARP